MRMGVRDEDSKKGWGGVALTRNTVAVADSLDEGLGLLVGEHGQVGPEVVLHLSAP